MATESTQVVRLSSDNHEIEVVTVALDPADLSLETAKALKALPEDWVESMLDLYDNGCSDNEVMRQLRMKPSHFRTLYKDTQACNFYEIVEVGRMLSRAWWETQGRKHLVAKRGGPVLNAALYKMQMENRFGWAAKSETSNTNVETSSLSNDEVDSKLMTLLQRAGLVSE